MREHHIDRQEVKSTVVDFQWMAVQQEACQWEQDILVLRNIHISENFVMVCQSLVKVSICHQVLFGSIDLGCMSCSCGDCVGEEEVMDQMEKFLMNHLLHWLEIMSLMGVVNHAAQLLLLAENWCRVSVYKNMPL